MVADWMRTLRDELLLLNRGGFQRAYALTARRRRSRTGGQRRSAELLESRLLLAGVIGDVTSESKISDTAGNFTATLDNSDFLGNAVASLGDLDGDGIQDLIAGAYLDDDVPSGSGAAYVLFMNNDGSVRSDQKISGTQGGFTGVLENADRFGRSLTNIGDLDSDGVTDIAVGVPGDDDGGSNRGAVYILFLNSDGTVKSHQKISTTTGGFTGAVENFDEFGSSLASPGDLDGDGVLDLIVGARLDDDGGPNRGAVYVLLLNSDGTVKSQQKISDTSGGLAATLGDSDFFGNAMAVSGDLDGDGVNDVVVGAYNSDDGGTDRGAVYVLFLNSSGTVKAEQKISNTSGGLSATLDDSDQFGSSITNMGDINGDGIDDLVIGARHDDDGGTDRGAAYVLFMNSTGTVKSHRKISNTSGNLTATLDNSDFFGTSVANVGDIDGDGLNDLAVGAYGDDDGGASRGAVYILHLNAIPNPGVIDETYRISDTSGSLSAALDNGDQFGRALTNIGDLDGDGVPDLVVSAIGDSDGGSGRGAAYVLFMNADGTVKSEQKISDTAGGFTGILDDGDQFGSSLTAIGDLDGDGVTELVVGVANDDDGGTNRGAIYTLFMNADGTVKSFQKASDTEGNFTAVLDDSDFFGSSVTGLGDLDGDGIEDVAVGARLDDDGGINRGAAYVLFMNADGTVKAHQKISDTAGGFTGGLNNGDSFGNSMANIGDLDGDGITDLAVGAYTDDDGGMDRGAMYVLFMNADGTVKGQQKISSTSGNFTAALDDGDEFGSAITSPGDLDGDGIPDLTVAARADDDGGPNRGAVYVLLMNADGTVKAHQKISDTQGNLGGTLADGDLFGAALTSLGDLNGDGISELAVGMPNGDDGGTDRGALFILTLEGVAPLRITDVKVSSSLWAADFKDALDGQVIGSGKGVGYSIPTGSASQTKSLPWSRIDQLIVTLADEIDESTVTANTNVLLHSTLAGPAISSVVVDGKQLQINLSAALKVNAFRLEIQDTVTSVAGLPLDGDFTNNSTSLSSGGPAPVGSPLNDFNFHISTNPGDSNQDGIVNISDAVRVFQNFLALPGGAGYSVFTDMTGDGIINISDAVLVFQNFLSLPPTTFPALLLGSGPGGGFQLPATTAPPATAPATAPTSAPSGMEQPGGSLLTAGAPAATGVPAAATGQDASPNQQQTWTDNELSVLDEILPDVLS
ncbi:MAG: FG-GAP-like repeat-containing protein [Planctomycetaceae bacterium]